VPSRGSLWGAESKFETPRSNSGPPEGGIRIPTGVRRDPNSPLTLVPPPPRLFSRWRGDHCGSGVSQEGRLPSRKVEGCEPGTGQPSGHPSTRIHRPTPTSSSSCPSHPSVGDTTVQALVSWLFLFLLEDPSSPTTTISEEGEGILAPDPPGRTRRRVLPAGSRAPLSVFPSGLLCGVPRGWGQDRPIREFCPSGRSDPPSHHPPLVPSPGSGGRGVDPLGTRKHAPPRGGPACIARDPRAYDRPGDPSPRRQGSATYYRTALSRAPFRRTPGSSAPGQLLRGTTARGAHARGSENTAGPLFLSRRPPTRAHPMVSPDAPATSTARNRGRMSISFNDILLSHSLITSS